MAYQKELLRLVDEDTDAFNKIMDAFGLPKKTDEEKAARKKAIQDATKNAIMVPFKVMETALRAMDIVKAMAETGNPNSVSDAGVGALAIRACIRGAFLNVKINAAGLDDKHFVEEIINKGSQIENRAEVLENEILQTVLNKI
jgi:glutamate formiminotransferase/formiminotetrahydrofolate cyclodeaminase